MKPTWKRDGDIIIVQAEQEYRFHWSDADVANALYQSLMIDYRQKQ